MRSLGLRLWYAGGLGGRFLHGKDMVAFAQSLSWSGEPPRGLEVGITRLQMPTFVRVTF